MISMPHSKTIVIGIFEPQADEDLNVSFKKKKKKRKGSPFDGVLNPLARIMATPGEDRRFKSGQVLHRLVHNCN
jgi:hypothetical protein